jgi:hypothetical protein
VSRRCRCPDLTDAQFLRGSEWRGEVRSAYAPRYHRWMISGARLVTPDQRACRPFKWLTHDDDEDEAGYDRSPPSPELGGTRDNGQDRVQLRLQLPPSSTRT